MNEELDELASAYVDGEASPDEIARVESDPELLSLVEEYRALRQSSLVAPPIDTDLQERHISAALAAFDELHASKPSLMAVQDSASSSPNRRADDASTDDSSIDDQATQSGGGAEATAAVSSLDARRSRRRPPAWLLNAAAAVVVLGGVGFAVTQLPDSTGDDAAVQTLDNAELEAEAADVSSASGAGQADGTATQLADQSPMAEAAEEEAAAEADDAMSDDEAMADEDESDDAVQDFSADDGENADETGPAPSIELFEGTETASEIFQSLGGPQSVADGTLELSPSDQTGCFEAANSIGEPLGFVFVGYGELVSLLLIFDVEGTQTPVLVDGTCGILSAE